MFHSLIDLDLIAVLSRIEHADLVMRTSGCTNPVQLQTLFHPGRFY